MAGRNSTLGTPAHDPRARSGLPAASAKGAVRRLVVLIAVLTLPWGCAHRRAVAPPPRLVAAHSLMDEGQFVSARKFYSAVRDSLAGTPAGAEAQYGLAYLNVFYRHPAPDWEKAVAEFERFSDEYPDDERIDEVKAWIRVLTELTTLQHEQADNAARLKELVEKREPSVRAFSRSGGYDVLLESVNHCYEERDSLLSRIKLLEDVIETIESSP